MFSMVLTQDLGIIILERRTRSSLGDIANRWTLAIRGNAEAWDGSELSEGQNAALLSAASRTACSANVMRELYHQSRDPMKYYYITD